MLIIEVDNYISLYSVTENAGNNYDSPKEAATSINDNCMETKWCMRT